MSAIRTAILGASGYTGAELVRLLSVMPEYRIAALSADRKAGQPPLHLVSAFATTQRLVLGQEAVDKKSNEITAIPVLIDRLAADDGLKGALVSIDAMGTNGTIASAIR